jgi:RHS repeat-associated protein
MVGKRGFSRFLVVVVCGAVVWSGVPVAAAAAAASGSEESGGALPDVWGHVTSVVGGMVGWLGDLFSAGEEVSEEPGPAGADRDRSGSAVLPGEETEPVGTQRGPAERVRELVSERSANAAVYELSDGRLEAEISTDPVHYRDGNGNWQKIDTTVGSTGRDGFVLGNSKNRFGSFFGTQSDRLLRFELGKRNVTVGVPGQRRELKPQADGDTVRYADVFGSADVQYRVSSEGVKKEIILEEAPEEASFTFTMRMGGVVAREMDDGSIGFFPPGKELAPVFRIPKPFMYDSADEPAWSDAVTQSVTQTGSGIEVTISADEEWLASDERVYPIVIDPTIIVEPTPTQGQDAMIRKAAPTTNYGESWQLGVGTDSVGAARSVLKFDVSWLPSNTVINTAQVKVWYDQGYYTNANAVSLQLRRVLGAWSESSITWNGSTGLAGELVSSVTKASYVNSVWHSYNAKPLVQGWVSGSIPNYGVLLRAQDESTLGRGGAYYEASEYAYNGGPHVNRPKLVITYGQPSVMLEPITTFYATGAELKWSPYAGSDIAEYQVHRSIWQTFTPTAATLVAPVGKNVTSFTDSTAAPTPADDPDPFGNAYYYQVAVKLTDGTILQGNTELARLPKAGRVKKIIRGSAVDTTLSSAHPTTNYDVFDGEPWLGAGDNGGSYGRTRTLVKFPDLGGHIPAGATVLDADLKLWKPLTFGSGARFNLHALTRGFDETTATWNRASSGTAWSTPGGDYSSTVVDYVPSMTTDSKFHVWWIDELVQQWVDTPSSNHGALIKIADESAKNQLSVFLSNEVASEPQLRPQLHVTYLLPTAESTYYAPATPKTTTAGEQRTVPVTITNTTDTVITAADHVLSYHWAAADGTEVTSSANRLETVLPANLPPGESVTVNAAVKSPQLTEPTNKREEFTLSWDVRNTGTGQWMSQSRNIPALDQSASVANPTSNQIGLEKFYQYTGTGTGGGSAVLNNLYAGNTVWSYDAFSNPSRGVSTSVRLAYNSLDTSNSAIGYGWSLSASSVMRMGTPLDFHPRGQQWPSQVTLTDGDGTAHLFTLNKHGSANEADWTYDSPYGVHLYLQKTGSTDPTRAWVMTTPDRTKFYFDADGYQTALADRNGNELVFTYENRKSNNKPIKFLRYVTDPHNRQTLTVDYYRKGDAYKFIDDAGAVQQGTNLTNPKIIDQVKTLTDISGHTIEFVYTDEGLLGRMTDGAGDPAAKVFGFGYDAEQGNKNVKLVEVTDPRGNTTDLTYFEAPTDPKAKWLTETITDRAGGLTSFAYVDPDGAGGDAIETTVTDAKTNATFYRMDGFGRPVLSTNANGETTQLSWDGDHNVIELVEDNGAVTSWIYDQNTGYPTLITDAEANANSTPGTALEYEFALGGHVADLVAKTSPEGLRWEFGYDSVGNLTSVTDPAGTATTDVPDDYTTTYSYNTTGTLATATDANGHTTTYAGYGPTGYPGSITDPLDNTTEFTYDSRGNVTQVTDAADNTSSYGWDVFGRLGESQVPKDADAGVYIVTPAPVYDGNDNVVEATAPNGAVTTYDYDAADRLVSTALPKDTAGAPDRVASYEYDLVGNLIAETEPNGTLTPANPDDFVTRYGYDPIYQLTSVTNAAGDKLSYSYDSVGNVVEAVDPRKNASADPDDVTTTSSYDLNHRVTSVTDAAGHTSSTSYDLDGLVVETTDKQGATTLVDYDPRGLLAEVRVPHEDTGGGIEYRTTRYEYDQAGNRTKVITPRGVQTTNTADDFVHQSVYDGLNRVIEQIHPYDPADPVFNTPDKTVYAYDTVGNLTSVSAPPSDGQTVRNTTTYEHFDNGWIKRSTDAWEITTSYDYNELGQQILRTLTSSGGASSRSMSWAYTPDGKLAGRGDDGGVQGKDVVLVDNSDSQNVEVVNGEFGSGPWQTADTDPGYHGYDYHVAPAGEGTNRFVWKLNIRTSGTYEVFVRYPGTTEFRYGFYSIEHADGRTATEDIPQYERGGEWVSLGSFRFDEGNTHKITAYNTPLGPIAADAVMLVRDTSGETDAEAKDITYAYDANGNLTGITDDSSGAQVDAYEIDYTGLNQVKTVEELAGGSVSNTTSFTYDANGNPLTTTHDDTYAEYTYDVRDLVEQVTNADTPSDPDPKVTGYTYTPNGWTATEAKPNGNTVTSEYYLDGLLKHQLETKANGTTVVAEHTIGYDPNGNRVTDVARTMDADQHNKSSDRTYTYTYDPRDRIAQVRKTDTSSGATLSTESYWHDPASNVIAQTIGGTTTAFVYDRNRLLTATTGGVTAAYNYDPFGRLNTVTSAGQIVESYSYDGFDRITEHTSIDQSGGSESTSYSYDPLDRTTSRTDTTGETTDYSYLGLSGEVLAEEIAGEIQKSYQYSPWGKRLSQITHNADGTEEDAYYGYNPHADVETLTDQTGDPVATYGYTAYGNNDEAEFTGIDAPDAGTPGDEPYNVYRYNAKRWDPGTGTYDMGFRDYNPGINRFLSRDMYTGALADLNLGLSPWTNNRYAFTGGNPITLIEHDGHEPRPWHDPNFNSDTFDYDTYWAAEKAAVDSAGSNNTSSGSNPSELEYADVEWECPQVYGGVVFINPLQALSFLFGDGGNELDFGGGDCDGFEGGGFDSGGFDGGGYDTGGFDGGGYDSGGFEGGDAGQAAMRPVVIGETMSRVEAAAEYYDAHYYRPWSDNFDDGGIKDFELAKERNRRAINNWMRQGRLIINIGLDDAREPWRTSPFYALEREEIARRGYTNVVNVYWPASGM